MAKKVTRRRVKMAADDKIELCGVGVRIRATGALAVKVLLICVVMLVLGWLAGIFMGHSGLSSPLHKGILYQVDVAGCSRAPYCGSVNWLALLRRPLEEAAVEAE
jgi:hypothetical protein